MIATCLNRIFIALIPKVHQLISFANFRPISLCNFIYKVISKISMNRICGLLGSIISPNQGAFVKGRWIAVNTIMAKEIVYKIRKHGKNTWPNVDET